MLLRLAGGWNGALKTYLIGLLIYSLFLGIPSAS
jgi:hypothetical protein